MELSANASFFLEILRLRFPFLASITRGFFTDIEVPWLARLLTRLPWEFRVLLQEPVDRVVDASSHYTSDITTLHAFLDQQVQHIPDRIRRNIDRKLIFLHPIFRGVEPELAGFCPRVQRKLRRWVKISKGKMHGRN